MPDLTDCEIAFLKFHLRKPRPHVWQFENRELEGRDQHCLVAYARTTRGPDRTQAVPSSSFPRLEPFFVREMHPDLDAFESIGILEAASDD